VHIRRYAIGEQAGKLIGDRLAKRKVRRRIVDTGYKLVPRDSA
jgi:DNA-binding LacI/PurR family transcriptional regulator